AAETVDAIERHNLPDLREELGDLLLQVLLQAQMADEASEFGLTEVIEGIANKLVRRHPHVFGSAAALDASTLTSEQREKLEAQIKAAESPEAVLELWDSIKVLEKSQTDQASQRSLLDNVPVALPALMQAQDISRKAISLGFDWPDGDAVWRQVAQELTEFQAEASGSQAAAEEFGDVLFSLVNVALREGIDAESALRGTIRRFRERWSIMEAKALREGRELSSYPAEQQEAFWQQAKQELASQE
ncbi:MAG: nucleoside triphosphate pyrophosphohydrolase, partial [Coriobacteriia bacterium]|nr:nucleoside triphosphate pyrophosphohydrolase [Coriobacteriia bacterium]